MIVAQSQNENIWGCVKFFAKVEFFLPFKNFLQSETKTVGINSKIALRNVIFKYDIWLENLQGI